MVGGGTIADEALEGRPPVISQTVGRKKPKLSEDKFEVRADSAFIERLDRHAARCGLTRAAYLRMMLGRVMDHEDQEAEHNPGEDR